MENKAFDESAAAVITALRRLDNSPMDAPRSSASLMAARSSVASGVFLGPRTGARLLAAACFWLMHHMYIMTMTHARRGRRVTRARPPRSAGCHRMREVVACSREVVASSHEVVASSHEVVAP